MAEVFPRDILFYGGGLALARFGALAARLNVPSRGGEEGIETVTRADASTCATLVDRDGVLREVAAHHARVEWRDTDGDGILDTPGLVSEFACTPAWTHPEALDNAAWTKSNVTIAADAAVAPDGTTTMDEMVETATVGVHHFVERATGALTDNRQQLTRFFCQGGDGRDWLRVSTLDKSNTFRSSWIDLVNRVAGTVNSGHKVKVRKLAGTAMEVEVTWNAASGATAPLVDLVIALADNDTNTYTGDVTKGVYVWGLQHIPDRGVGQSHVANIVGSVLTRADEAITAPIPFAPQDLTILFDHARNVVDDLAGVGLNVAEGRGIFDLGDAGTNHVWCYHDFGGTRQINFGVRGATTDAAVVRGTPAGERIRAICQVRNFATGPSIAADVGAGLSAFSGVTEPFQKWQNQRIRLGGIVNSNLRLCAPLYRVVVARGLHSWAEMVAIP